MFDGMSIYSILHIFFITPLVNIMYNTVHFLSVSAGSHLIDVLY